MSDKKKNKALEKRISFYPSAYYNKLTIAYAYDKHQGKSETEKEINKCFFDAMKPEAKERLLKIYGEMDAGERSRPRKL